MDWKKYQKEIHQYFSDNYTGASIRHDVKIYGRYSKKERQVDILIEDEVAGYPIKIAVDAKNFSKKIDVKCVESFISMLEDVDVHQGLLITNKGFSPAAINRAYYGPHKLELDILNFDELLKNQALRAVPYSDNKALLLSAPFGWVIDNSRDNSRIIKCLATLYQRGRSLQDAQKAHEWTYLNFWHKDEVIKNIDDLISFQNEGKAHYYTNLKIYIEMGPKRKDGLETKIRGAIAKEIPCKEITGFIDCGDYIAFLVMFTIEQLETKNRRKLDHLLKYSLPGNITFKNALVIEDALQKLTHIKDREERSELFRQIAIWYAEMRDDQNALKYRRLSQKEYERNYLNIKPLISLELRTGNPERALDYSALLFGMDPTNPTMMQDILSIYDIGKFDDLYLRLIDSLKAEFSGNHEALGNIYFHHGIRLSELGNINGAIDCMNSAKIEFTQVFKKTHYVFEQIEKNLFFVQQPKPSDPK